jgi:hypothetical protein
MVIAHLYQRYITYSQRARKLEKGTVATMNTVNDLQKARYALVPMRKAMMDALLLTAFILIILVFTGILFTYQWLILPIYGLALLLTVVLRLRQVVRETTVVDDQEQSFDIGQMLYAGMVEPLQTATFGREQS